MIHRWINATASFVHRANPPRPPQRERCRVRSNFTATTTTGPLCYNAKNKKKQRVSGTPRCNSCQRRSLINATSRLEPRLIVNGRQTKGESCARAAQCTPGGGSAKFRETDGNCETMRCESWTFRALLWRDTTRSARLRLELRRLFTLSDSCLTPFAVWLIACRLWIRSSWRAFLGRPKMADEK